MKKFFLLSAAAAFLAAIFTSTYGSAQCTTNCVITNPSGTQTITQGSGTSLTVSGNLAATGSLTVGGNVAPQSVDYTLYVDTFAGTDIGAKLASAVLAIPSGACSAVLLLSPLVNPATSTISYSTNVTVSLPALSCSVTTGGQGKLIIDFNNAPITYTGAGDFLRLLTGSGNGEPYQPLELRHLNLWGTSASTGCGVHTRSGSGMLIEDGSIWGFTHGSAICLENYNGGWQEEWTIRKMTFGQNQKSIQLFQNATTPGTASFEYSTIQDVHFQLNDSLTTPCIGVSVEGTQSPSVVNSNTFGGKWDLAYNIDAASTGCALVQVSNGGQLQRTDLTTRGEQTTGSAQSYIVKIADNYSGVNTPVRPFNGPGPLEMVGIPTSWTGTSCGAAAMFQAYGDGSYELECAVGQSQISKWFNHTGLNNGFTKLFAAAPSGQHWGGLQVLGRDTTNPDPEVDVIGSSGNRIYNILFASGDAVGIGPGFKDYTNTGYAVTSALRSAGVVTATFATAPSGLNTGTALVEGMADPSFNGEVTISSVSGTTATWSQGGYSNNSTTGGAVYGNPIYPVPSLDVIANPSGGLRVGTNTAGTPGGFTGSVYSQLATFVTASYTPGSVPAGTCTDKNVAASGPGSVTPVLADIPIAVTSAGTLGNIIVTAARTTTAGDVTLHFCNVSTLAISPTAAVYTIVMIH